MDERILKCIYEAIDEANEDRADLPPLQKSPETTLHGSAGDLDSLGLINFLVAAEEGIEREFGVEVSLSDNRSISREPSPFESVETLATYIETLLAERRG